MTLIAHDGIRLTRLKRRRKRWLSIHLWLGLLLGVYLSIIGLTGAILAFYPEIDAWLNPGLLVVEPPFENADYKSLEEIIAAADATMPAGSKQAFAVYPHNLEASFGLRYILPSSNGATETWEVFVDPYRAVSLGKRLANVSDHIFPETFVNLIFVLHYSLFLGDYGELIVSIIGALSIISVLTGLIVWWPLTGKWRKALTIKSKASQERLIFDLHKTAGFYTSAILLPVLFSGIYITEPKYLVPLVELFSPTTYRYWFKSTPSTDSLSLNMADAVAIADRLYSDGRVHFIYGATQPTSTFTVCKNDVEQMGSLIHRRCVVIDRYSGKVLDIDDPTIGTAGEVFSQWQWPLHSGQAFGVVGRILVCLSGVGCQLLFLTGVIRWLQKRRAEKVRWIKN